MYKHIKFTSWNHVLSWLSYAGLISFQWSVTCSQKVKSVSPFKPRNSPRMRISGKANVSTPITQHRVCVMNNPIYQLGRLLLLPELRSSCAETMAREYHVHTFTTTFTISKSTMDEGVWASFDARMFSSWNAQMKASLSWPWWFHFSGATVSLNTHLHIKRWFPLRHLVRNLLDATMSNLRSNVSDSKNECKRRPVC